MVRKAIRTVALAAVVTLLGATAKAETRCGPRLTRKEVVQCALERSPELRGEHEALAAARGRREASGPFLPSRPTLTVTGSRRSAAARTATNWSAELAQELPLGGQRGARRDAADAEIDAERHHGEAARRDVAAGALAAFYDALATREEAALAARLAGATRAFARAARARSDAGLAGGIEGDLAEAAAVHADVQRLAAEREAQEAAATLTSLVGGDPLGPAIEVDGELAPVAGIDEAARRASAPAANPPPRPELLSLAAERRAHALRATAARRSWVPNPTLSAFVQEDGFDERVFGVGLSFPLPIPAGTGYGGEASENDALARRAEAESTRVERSLRLGVATAIRAYESRGLALRAFAPELLRNAEASLATLEREVAGGRLSVRDAVVAAGPLVELLVEHVEARRALCLASVDLARALGLPLEGGTR